MLKAAILGAGFIAGFHADGYMRLLDVQLCGICDQDAKRAAAMADKYHCAAYLDAMELLEREKPDLVSVCLPTFLHAPYTIAALQSGAHVLCEKPMALTMEACQEMHQAMKRTHRTLMIGQVLRWWPEYVSIREEKKRMGIPRYIRCQRLQHPAREGWFMQPDQGGGALFDLLVHDLDYVCFLMESVPHILSANGHRGKEGSWRRISVSLAWDNGTFAQLEACNCMPAGYPFTASFHMEYENSALDYSFRAPVNIQKDAPTHSELLLFENGNVRSLPVENNAQSIAFNEEIAAFVRYADSGRSENIIEGNLNVMALIHQIKTILES